MGRLPDVTRGIILDEIEAERERQQSVEGWTPQHDDTHASGEMAMAAACYAAPREIFVACGRGDFNYAWPWDSTWDKRHKHDRRRQLVIAAALIVAEVERLDRAAAAAESEE